MNFKKVRYNLIVIGLVALVLCYMGMSIFFAPSAGDVSNPGSAQEEPIEDPTIPGDDELDEGVGGDDTDEESEIPSGAIDLINYGIDILNNGQGFECTLTSSITNTPAVPLDISPVQNLTAVIARGVNSKGEKVGYEKDFYYTDYTGIGGSSLARYFRGFYDNQTTGQVNMIETADYNVSALTYNKDAAYVNENKSIDSILDKFKILYTRDFPITFSKKNCTIIKDDSKTSKTRRIITVSVKVSSLPQEYGDYYTATGDMKDVNYKKVEVSFVINKKNGYIMSIERNELFNAMAIDVPALGTTSIQSSIKTKQIFSNMNKTVVISDSL